MNIIYLSLFNPLFICFFLYFLFVIFLAFYIPGFIFVKKLPVANFEKTVIAIITGMVLWGWQGMIFGYLHVRWMSYLYITVLFFLWLYLERGSIFTLQLFRKKNAFLVDRLL